MYEGMKAISIQQPYAWLIVEGHKNVENRGWSTAHRGPILIHASRKNAWGGNELLSRCEKIISRPGFVMPDWEDYQRGGIIGQVDITDCVNVKPRGNKWWEGPFGFLLANAKPLEFFPCRGQLGIFTVGEESTGQVKSA